MQKKSHLRRLLIGTAVVGASLAIVVAGAGAYFFHVAEVRAKKNFIGSGVLSKNDPLYPQQQAYQQYQHQEWQLTAHDGTKLVGYYTPATVKTTKTALVIHGFGVDHRAMAPYAAMFHQQGYNVLLLDNRAAGKSGGHYIGFGYLEAQDAKQWTQKIVAVQGQQTQIVVMGASLGGATTMMLSGMQPPKQVKAYVEDAGYASIHAELMYQAEQMYGLPKWIAKPLLAVVSGYSKLFAGYAYSQGNVTQYLAKNTRPMFFIHGANDTFVPTRFINDNYQAQKGPKAKMIVKKAQHVQSYATDIKMYEQRVANFLAQYVHD
ncbi:alpha/beta hydrolase [Weissella diestrammenae]|uniref:Alpha/beta hydrolase n=1 Tax=Weissella diestrammenae TaxID=1162633 RepID=A0A7G9T6Q3_9LACO|nr:alpha/beta hydrolase [Weissella diestrammenae]MCM0582936.1 alpha/beta hydrolase [Weissella diestrammenae]QNN75778.1 alpha/beta hydrolase [Weissella diestrammenae]